MNSSTIGKRLVTAAIALLAFIFTLSNLALGERVRCELGIAGTITRRTDLFGQGPTYRAVIGEEVFLLNSRGEEIARVRTNRNGRYAFRNLCPGTYTVRPGLEGPNLPTLYEPSSLTITIPTTSKSTVSSNHLNFVQKSPPPHRQPADERTEMSIQVDESVKGARDLQLANRVKTYLTSHLLCPGRLCRVNILVRNGHVSLSGLVGFGDKAVLERIRSVVTGVRSVNTDRISTQSS